MENILVFGMNENPGGVESFIMNYYRHFDKSKLHFDFLCNSMNKIAYEEEILKNGSRVYHIPARSKNPLKYYWKLYDFFKKHSFEYKAIWININSLANIDYLKMAKKFNIPVRIVHSHNSQNMDSKFRKFLHLYHRKRISKWATNFWACSKDAETWFFDNQNIQNTKIIPNAIDIEKTAFSNLSREKIRNQYGLNGKFVIGNIGRLHFQKNQEFILNILAELLEIRSDIKLILIGQGEDELKLKDLAYKLGVYDNVIFTGVQSNIQEWLSAFDLFLFPSKFEGLPIAPFEAQANGLPVLVSAEGVPSDTKVNENLHFYSLKNSYQSWAKKIISLSINNGRLDEKTIDINFSQTGYNIKLASKELECYFLEIIK